MDMPHNFANLSSKDQTKVTNLIYKLSDKAIRAGDNLKMLEGQDTHNTQSTQDIPDTQDNQDNQDGQDGQDAQGKQDRSVRLPPASQIKRVPQQGTPSQKRNKQTKQTGRPKNKSRLNLHKKAQQSEPREPQISYGTVDPSLPMNAPHRPNMFIDNGFAAMHQKDSEIDHKLSGANQITPRGTRQEVIEIECRSCGNVDMVSMKMVQHDQDGVRFICDHCQKNRR